MSINVHFATENNTVEYTKFAIETMLRLANKPNEIITTIHILETSPQNIISNLNKVNCVMVTNSIDKLRGSFGHGLALEQMLSFTKDENTHIIMDSDTVLLAKDWDLYAESALKTFDCIGTEYENIGGFSSGDGKLQTYKNIPNFIWLALTPKHDWTNLKAAHQKSIPIDISTEELSKIYNLPIGYQVLCDVGWQLPAYLHKNNLTHKGIRQIKPSSDESVVLHGLSDYHEEYHVNNAPFLVHQRGSSKHAFRKGISKNFYDAVDAYIKNHLI